MASETNQRRGVRRRKHIPDACEYPRHRGEAVLARMLEYKHREDTDVIIVDGDHQEHHGGGTRSTATLNSQPATVGRRSSSKKTRSSAGVDTAITGTRWRHGGETLASSMGCARPREAARNASSWIARRSKERRVDCDHLRRPGWPEPAGIAGWRRRQPPRRGSRAGRRREKR
jgi:hypothetical protein